MKKLLHFKPCLLVGLFFLLLASGNVAMGAVRVASVTGNWNNVATWGGLSVPGVADDIIINNGITVTLTANRTCRTIADMAGGLISGANTLTIAGNAGVAITNITGSATISCPVVMPATALITVAGSLTISGIVSGAATSITKAGAGILILTRANTYVGATLVSAGILNIRNGTATGTVAGGVTVSTGARLEMEGGIMVGAEALSLSGEGGGINGGALYSVSGSNMWTGSIAINGALTRINSAVGDLILAAIDLKGNLLIIQGGSTNSLIGGIISSSIGAGSITKINAGSWTLSGANTFSGGVTLSEGTLNINNSRALGTVAGTFTIGGAGNAVTIDNTTGAAITMLNYPQAWNDDFTFTGTRALNLGSGAVTMSNSRQITTTASTLTVGGIINSSTLNLTKAGLGALSFNNQAITLNSLIINDGAFTSTSAAGSMNLAGNFINNGTFNSNGGTVTLNGSSIQNIGGTQVTTFNNLTLANSSGATLGNSETISGTLTLTSGRLKLGSNNLTLGSAAVAGSPSVSNMIVADGTGECRRVFTANGSYVFPIGDETGTAEYSPITLNFTSGTYSSAYAAVRVTDAKHPNDLSPTNFISRYWTVSQSGITSYLCNVTGTFPAADVNGTVSNMVTGEWNGSAPWQNFGPVTATTISANAVASLSEFTGISLSTLTVSITANPVSTVCKDAPLTLTANPVGDPGFTYLWAPNGETTQSINPSTAIPGSILYSVIVKDVNGFTATDNVTVTVNPVIIATATPSDQSICTGTSSSIALSSNIAGTTFAWTVVETDVSGASDGSGATIAQTHTATGSIPGTATYTITPTANGCTGAPITVVITVNPIPVAIATPASQTICSGTAPSIALTSNVSGTTFTWTVVQSGVSGASAGTGTSIAEILTATGIIAGTATYTVTPTANGCAGIPIPVLITIKPIPVVTATPVSQTICSGTAPSIALTSNVAGTNFIWMVAQAGVSGASVGSGSPIDQILTATGTTAGTATYTVAPLANGCAGVTLPVIITVNPIPVVTATPSVQTICSGTAPAIALTSNVSGTTFVWTVAQSGVSGASLGSGTPIAQILTATGITAGTATYTIAPLANGCAGATIPVTITVNPGPAATATPSSQTVCSGTAPSIALSSNISGTTFAWTIFQSGVSGASAGSGTTIAQTLTATGATAGTATYTITPSVSGCAGTPIPVVITVNPIPTVIATPPAQTICSVSAPSIALTSNVAGTAFAWTVVQSGVSGASAGSGTSIAQTLTATGITSGTATFTITPTANGCTGTSITVVITVNPVPGITATPSSQTICSGTAPSVALTSNVSGTTFTWSVIQTGVSGASAGSGTTIAQTLSATGGTAGTATYTVTPTVNGCAGIPIPVVITVNPIPVVTATPSSQTICSGTAPSIALTSNVSGTLFVWTPVQSGVSGASLGSGTPIAQTLTATGTTAGTATYTVAPLANGCAGATLPVVITVNPIPIVTTTPASQTICSGTAPSIALSSNIAGSTYAWTVVQSGVSGALAGSGTTISQILTATGIIAGTATYTITPTANSCSGNAITVVITVNPSPTVTATPSSQTICSGTAPLIALSSNVSGTSYAWTVVQSGVSGASAGSGTIIAQTLSATGITTGTVTYTINSAANGCSGTPITVVISVNPIPIVTTTPSAQTICSGVAPSIVLTSNVSGATFAWTIVQSGVSGASAGSGTNIAQVLTATGTTAGTATYSITPTANTCSGTIKTVVITVNPIPVVTATPPSQTICSGTAPSISLTSNITGTTYAWTAVQSGVSGASSGSGTPINQIITTTGTAAGTATYTITPTINGCAGTPMPVVITVNPIPVVTVTPASQTICSGTSTSITLTSNISGTTFAWTVAQAGVSGATATSGAAIAQILTATGTTSGTATYSITPSANGCTGATKIVVILVNPTPVVTASPASQTICSGTAPAIALSSNISGTTFAWTVVQSGVSGASSGSGATIAQNLTVTGTTAGTATYTITPTANGCTGNTLNVVVTVNPIPTLSSPLTASVCTNTLFSYNPTSNTPSATFTWTRAAVLGIQNLASSGSGAVNETLINITGFARTVTYIYTITANGCTRIQNVAVTVYPLPIMLSWLTPSSVCSNAPFNYIPVSSVAGTTFTWVRDVVAGISNPAGAGTGNISETLVNTTNSDAVVQYVYTMVVGSCTNTATVNVTIKPSVVLSSTLTPDAICNNSIFTYNPTSTTPGTTFSWSRFPVAGISNSPGFGTNNPNEFLNNITTNPVNVTYIYTLQANGCSYQQNVVVTVNPKPTVNGIPDQEFCSGVNTPVISFNGPVSGSSFAWTNNNPAIGLAANGSGNIPSFTATNITSLPIFATITVTPSANGCDGTPSSFIILVNPTATANTPASQNICNGAPSTAVFFTGTLSSISWTNNHPEIGLPASGTGNIGSFTGINPGLNPIVATITATPHFSVSGTNCDGNPVTFSITVNPSPAVNAVSNETLCAGDNHAGFVFTTSANGGSPVFNWTCSSNLGFGTSGIGSIPAFVATNGGVIPLNATISVSVTMNGCTGGASTFAVTVNPSPSVVQPVNQDVCNTGITTGVHFTGTATSYAWTNNNNTIGLGVSGTGDIGAFIALNSGAAPVIATITVTPSYTNGGKTCQGPPKSFSITVNPSPASSIAGTTSVCRNAASPAVTFTGANGIAPYTFTYQINGGANQTVTTISGNSVTVSVPTAAAGIFTYKIISVAAANGCSQVQSITAAVTVEDLPTATISGTTTVCLNSSAPQITFTAANGTPPYTFTYQINGGSSQNITTISGNSITLSAPTNAAGTFVYSLVNVLSSTGCSQAQSGTATVSVNPTPNLVTNNPASVCSPATADLTTSAITAGSAAGLTFTYWTDAAATILFNTPTTAGNGTYYIKGYDPVAGCSAIKPVTVIVNPTPTLVITNPVPICAPATVNLTLPAVTSGSTAGLIYTYWTDAAATISYPTPASADDDTYYIKGTTAAGCFEVKPVIASVFSTLTIPVFALGTSSSICKGSAPITYNATVTNAFTLTYSLDAASLAAGNTINPGTGLVTFAPGWTGTSQITATATGCGAPASAIHTVTINPTPLVSLVAVPSTSVCEGTSITLTATSSGGTVQKSYSGASGNINQIITDNSKAAYAYSTITLSGSGGSTLNTSDLIIVTANINHNSDQDLDIFLVDPSGTRAMLLSSDNGGTGNNYINTILRTDAPNVIGSAGFNTAPFTSTYRPEGTITTVPDITGAAGGGNYAVIPASALNGAPIDGAWSLRVFDDLAGTTGTLVNWSLTITEPIGSGYTTVVNGPQVIGPVTYSGANNSIATAVVTPPAGTQVYTVTTTDSKGCSATSNAVSLVIKPAPVPIITADYCTYRPKVRLTTPSCASCTYLWNTGATTNIIDVDIAGKYTVIVTYANGCTRTSFIQVADELVTNGDFSAGNTGFTTDYGYRANVAGNTELNPEGLYGVGTSGQNYHSNFWGLDHTTNNGTGNYMIVNGWGSTFTVWQETNVPVVPNTDYYFAAWAISLNNVGPFAKLRFEVNGVQVGSTANLISGSNNNANAWRPQDRFYGIWNSGVATTATIRIINLEPNLNGNDFGIDDISFGTLVNTPFSVSASNNSPVGSPICSRGSLQLTSTITGGRPPIVYTWTGPNGFLSHNANPVITNIPPNGGGTYTLSVVDFYNCPAEVATTVVSLNPTPEIPDQTALICSSSLFNVTPVNGVPNASTFVPAGTTYSWPAPTISPAGSVTGASANAGQISISQLLTNTTNLTATVTYTVTPVAGSCTGNTFKVIVTVNPAATINAGGNQQICAGSTANLNGSIGGAAVSGNWTGGTGSFTPNRNTLNAVYTPSAAEITTGTVTLTLNSNDPDGAGPCTAANSTVIITINALPVLTFTRVNLACHGASTGSIDLTASGGTPAFTFTWTASSGGVVPFGQASNQDLSGLVAGTYTIVVQDTKTCGATVSITLTEPALLVASESHATVPCSIGATSVTITAAGGTAPYSGTGTFAQFAGTITYTVTDANGCTATVAATVAADPNSAPVITTCPVTRNFNGCSTASISGPVFSGIVANSSYLEYSNANNNGVATDNCVITTVTYQDVAALQCPIQVTRTWTLGDASGLTATCQQLIKVTDIDAPFWTTVAGALNRTIECSDAAGLAAAQALYPVASDVCDPDVSNIVKTSGSFIPSAGCSQKGTYINTWKVTDECGNISATYSQVITITDNTPPAWTTIAGTLDQTLECSDITGLLTAQTLKPVASDQCDGNVTNIVKVNGSFIPGGACGYQGTYTNTWTVSDDCGNVSANFTQVIIITDNSSPVWLTAPGALDRTIECSNVAGLAAIQAMYPVAWDNCSSDVTNIIKTFGPFVPSAGCALEGTYTNTWTVADDCGNTSAVYTQIITIDDNTDPVILCPPSDAYSCDSPSFDPSVTGMAVASSDCAANPAVAWSDVIVPGGCAGNYQIVRTWTATNICGNTNSCEQTIFVQDVTPPVIICAVSGNQNIYPNPAIAYIHPDNSWDATATDNCSGVTLSVSLTGATISGPYTSLNGVSFNEGVTTVTWTATDGCGISADCEFTVTVIFKPEISCPADITINNDPNVCSATFIPGFPSLIIGTTPIIYTWNMTGATLGSGTGSIGNYTFNGGITLITWTATNDAGSDVCIQTITILDNQAPDFSVPADKIYCVQEILSAGYFDPTTDITPDRPDYYVFVSGNTDLNLNPATFIDNCPASCVYEIRWRIDFQDGTILPALPATYLTGQPSALGADIQFPGNAISGVVHKITYQVVDCSGNVSASKSVNITVNPRPNVIKLN